MPRNKDLKRIIRARMSKTGEAYTAARAQVVRKTAGALPAIDHAALAGRSDATIREKTGRTWKEWMLTLDSHGAERMRHRDIAALLNTKYSVDGWWSQMVTVGYERIKGVRVVGQRLDGTHEAGKSRTYAVPVTRLFEAWAKPAVRKSWLKEESVKVRTATARKSMRLGWSDGTIVVIGFESRGRSRSSVSLSHTKLPDRATANRLKQFWSDRLDALGEVLTGK